MLQGCGTNLIINDDFSSYYAWSYYGDQYYYDSNGWNFGYNSPYTSGPYIGEYQDNFVFQNIFPTVPGTTYTCTFFLGPSLKGSGTPNRFHLFIVDTVNPPTSRPTPVFTKTDIDAQSAHQVTFTTDPASSGFTTISFGGWSKTGFFYVASARCVVFSRHSLLLLFGLCFCRPTSPR